MSNLLRPLLAGLLLSACIPPASAPVLEDGSLTLGNLQHPYLAVVEATGGEGALSYGIRGAGLPPGLALAADGTLSGTPTLAGIFNFSVLVRDASDRSDTGSITVEILTAAPPQIAGQAQHSAMVGAPYASSLIAEGGTQPYSWTATGLPAGISLTSAGALSGTPTTAGDYSLTATVVDARGQTDQATVNLVVRTQLTISTSALADGYTDASLSQTLETRGGVAPFSWTVTAGALPPATALSSSGVLSGIPTATGTSAVTLTVTDGEGHQASRALSLEVLAPPQVTTAALAAGLVGSSYSQTVEAAGGRSPLTLTQAGTLPGGLSWNAASISGTPATAGSAALSFTVTDANGRSTSKPLTLSVYDSLTVTTLSLPTGYASSAYTTSVAAIGGSAPYAFTVTAGALPAGISLASSGALGGTTSSTGDFTFTVRVTDSVGLTASRELVLKVRAPVAIITASLPDAYRGSGYPQSLIATGGEGTLTWTLTSGTLPSGLSFSSSGALSGTVGAAASTASLTFRATDVNGQFDSRVLSVSVYSAPEITTTTLPAGTVGAAYSQALAVTGGKPSLSFTRELGGLPPGLSLDGLTGQLSGMPTADGSYSFTLRVEDGNGRSDTQALTLEVAPGSGTPAILEVASWNIEWFGDPSKTPEDATQLENATRVISETGAQVWGLVEMVDTTQFNSLVSSLSGYAGFLANHASVTNGSSYYSAAEQKLGFLYDTSTVQVHAASLILTAQDATFAGRPPLRVDTTVTVDGNAVDITFIMVHLKAFADVSSRTKREAAAAALKDYLDTQFATGEVMVLGDWNDDVDQSITWDSGCGCYLDTPFLTFVSDTADYRYLTAVLSESGISSTTGYPELIDHHLTTNELTSLHVGTSEVIRPDQWTVPVSNYDGTTSDHYPVVTRFDLTGQGGGGGGGGDESAQLIINEVLYDEPGIDYSYEFVEIRNVGATSADLTGWTLSDYYFDGTTTYSALRHQFTGTLAAGAAVVVFGGASALSGAPPNAVAASQGIGLSLHPADSVRLHRPSGTIKDSVSWTSTSGDDISINRAVDGDGTAAWVPHTELTAFTKSPGTRADLSGW